jgi:hypothetical protein
MTLKDKLALMKALETRNAEHIRKWKEEQAA